VLRPYHRRLTDPSPIRIFLPRTVIVNKLDTRIMLFIYLHGAT
jgi:hypothetical protein